MVMHSGERWRCINLSCRCTIVVESGTSQEGGNPRCSCGSIMKKEFKPPVIFDLNFLKLDPPLLEAEKSGRA